MAEEAAALPAQGAQDGVITDEESRGNDLKEEKVSELSTGETGNERETEPSIDAAKHNEGSRPLEPSGAQAPVFSDHHGQYQPQPQGMLPLAHAPRQYPQPFIPSLPPPLAHIHPSDNPVVAMHSFYEARMRDHAAAYANAAAGAAWAAAQMAQAAAEFAAGYGPPPPCLAAQPNCTGMLPFWSQPPPAPASIHLQQFTPHPSTPQGYPGMHDYYPTMPDHSMDSTYPPISQETYPPSFLQDDTHGRKRPERPPSDNDSSSVPKVIHQPSSSRKSYNCHNNKMRRRRLSNDSRSSSSDASSMLPHQDPAGSSHYKQRQHRSNKQRNNLPRHAQEYQNNNNLNSHSKRFPRPQDWSSLLGKTAVSALFEWCDKMHYEPPSFVHPEPLPTNEKRNEPVQKECVLSVNGIERGQGRGGTKAAARQDAARRALLALVPGVVFDSETGLLSGLPEELCPKKKPPTRNRAASMDEELPNLAKRLAIGRDEDSSDAYYAQDSTKKKKRLKSSRPPQPKRSLGLYPASSTTTASEDDVLDDNAYYKSRGANVCSVLLHAMVQIAKVSPPEFDYDWTTSQAHVSGTGHKHIGTQRGPFLCRVKWTCPSPLEEGEAGLLNETNSNSAVKEMNKRFIAAASDEGRVLVATGAGGNKREARHVASAALLALLFPECETIVEVKAAAEAIRERFAYEKAQKQNYGKPTGSEHLDSRQSDASRPKRRPLFALHDPGDPDLPLTMQKTLLLLLGSGREVGELSRTLALSDSSPESVLRRMSRQKQIALLVENALQTLNEKDEEGRSKFELSEDDVGKLLLRRALAEDFARIKKLFASESSKSPVPRQKSRSHATINEEEAGDCDLQNIWSMPCIVLLLCRAIAPYDDPPLGCAILTRGFSMEHGQLLYIARVASEPHLPKERLMEYLAEFAGAMKCRLEDKFVESEILYRSQELEGIVKSHLPGFIGTEASVDDKEILNIQNKVKKTSIRSTLQSVQEESEHSDSSSEKRSKKPASKPSKRSRFQ